MLASQQKTVGKQAGSSHKRPLSGDARQVRKIIAFRKMAQNDVRCLPVIATFKEFRSGFVGEMPHPRQYPLLHRPWVGSVAQHFQVMI